MAPPRDAVSFHSYLYTVRLPDLSAGKSRGRWIIDISISLGLDRRVYPEEAVLTDAHNVIVPARYLINDRSLTRATGPSYTYYEWPDIMDEIINLGHLLDNCASNQPCP